MDRNPGVEAIRHPAGRRQGSTRSGSAARRASFYSELSGLERCTEACQALTGTRQQFSVAAAINLGQVLSTMVRPPLVTLRVRPEPRMP
jgi:hypothetical protein